MHHSYLGSMDEILVLQELKAHQSKCQMLGSCVIDGTIFVLDILSIKHLSVTNGMNTIPMEDCT